MSNKSSVIRSRANIKEHHNIGIVKEVRFQINIGLNFFLFIINL